MSSVYWPLPVMKRWSSLRRTGAPIPVALTGILLGCSIGLLLPPADRRRKASLLGGLAHAAHAGRARPHGGDDVVIAGTAAQVAFQPLAHRVLVELVALAVYEVNRRHDHAGGAEAA